MTKMTGPDCAVMCNLISTQTHTQTQQVSLILPREDQCERHRMPRMTGLDSAVMCNLINTHTHTYSRAEEKQISGLIPRYLLPPSSRYVDMW